MSDGYNRIPILIQFLLDVNCATHSPGKEGVVKSVGVTFYLFLWLMSPTGGEATYVVKMSE